MRRVAVLALALVALLAASPPDVLAQAATSKVTITGLIDNVVNWNRNVNMTHGDFDITRSGDKEFYSRTRGRFDIVGEVGKAKGVLGLEIDMIYGQTGAADSCAGPFQTAGCRPDGTSGGFDADNDVRNAIELRWMYVVAPLPGLPWATNLTMGGQPFTTTTTYKPGIYAGSDFAGFNLDIAVLPNLKVAGTYAQWEEQLTGQGFGSAAGFQGFRAEDYGIFGAVEFKPFKGLDLLGVYNFSEINGTTSANIRRGTGGLAATAAVFPNNAQEDRHTIGVDARWRMGPFSLDPTFLFQFGDRQTTGTAATGGRQSAEIRAWIGDVTVGYRVGPLLLEVRGMATSGNKAGDDLRGDTIEYYQPVQTGNFYWIGWGEAVGIGAIDYLTSLYSFSNALSLPAQPSYDRYGRIMFAPKVTYSVTPAFSLYGIVTPMWTFEKVDTDGTAAAGTGITPAADASGDSRYLGTGVTGGFTYRFAPGLVFDAVWGILVPGDGLNINGDRDAENVQTASARIRFTF